MYSNIVPPSNVSLIFNGAKEFNLLPFSFLETVASKNYVAIDFYDGSIIYDFNTDKITICDIDFFKKKPVINNMGKDFWGSKRFKSPEEYVYGEIIDERTNVFTLGAMIFEFFGSFSQAQIDARYKNNIFLPCELEHWTLNEEAYNVVCKTVNLEKSERYKTISEFNIALKRTLY